MPEFLPVMMDSQTKAKFKNSRVQKHNYQYISLPDINKTRAKIEGKAH